MCTLYITQYECNFGVFFLHLTYDISHYSIQYSYYIKYKGDDALSDLRLRSVRSLFKFSFVFHIISGTVQGLRQQTGNSSGNGNNNLD